MLFWGWSVPPARRALALGGGAWAPVGGRERGRGWAGASMGGRGLGRGHGRAGRWRAWARGAGFGERGK